MTQALRVPVAGNDTVPVHLAHGEVAYYGAGVLILCTMTGRPCALAEGEWDRLVNLGAEVVEMGNLDELTSHPR